MRPVQDIIIKPFGDRYNNTCKVGDKDLILKTLDKISATYQQYSFKDRITGLENGIKYLEDQIKIYKINSQNSYSEFLEYAIENNMNTFFISGINSNEDFSRIIDTQSGIQKDSELRKKIKLYLMQDL